jgi:Fungal specific transcription factor domain
VKHVDIVRFVGDIHPESILTDLAEQPEGTDHRNRVGVWVAANTDTLQDFARADPGHDRTKEATPNWARRSRSAPLNLNLMRYLQDMGAFLILPKRTQEALISIYFTHIHPLIPLVDKDSFLSAFSKGESSNLLVLAICLAASKSSEAAPYLQVDVQKPVLAARAFAKQVYEGLQSAINANLEEDPLFLIQICGLMSLHNDGPQGLEKASMHLSNAIQRSFSLGLHVGSSRRFPPNGHTEKMFWSLWCLDKWSAAMACRPIGINDHDIGIARPVDTYDSRQGLFQDHLTLCAVVAKIIGFYWPTSDQNSTGWEENFPTFTEIMKHSDCQQNHELCEYSFRSTSIRNKLIDQPSLSSFSITLLQP